MPPDCHVPTGAPQAACYVGDVVVVTVAVVDEVTVAVVDEVTVAVVDEVDASIVGGTVVDATTVVDVAGK